MVPSYTHVGNKPTKKHKYMITIKVRTMVSIRVEILMEMPRRNFCDSKLLESHGDNKKVPHCNDSLNYVFMLHIFMYLTLTVK